MDKAKLLNCAQDLQAVVDGKEHTWGLCGSVLGYALGADTPERYFVDGCMANWSGHSGALYWPVRDPTCSLRAAFPERTITARDTYRAAVEDGTLYSGNSGDARRRLAAWLVKCIEDYLECAGS